MPARPTMRSLTVVRRSASATTRSQQIDAPVKQMAQLAAGGVLPHHAAAGDLGLQGSQHVGDVGRPARPGVATIGLQNDDRRFGADPFDIPLRVAIEHQIAQHQCPRASDAQ